MATQLQISNLHQFRHYVLDEAPEQFATEDLMLAAGRFVYGNADIWSLFNLLPHQIIDKDVRVRCRTLIESVIDSMAITISRTIQQRLESSGALDDGARASVYDLFCGSGNMSFHFSQALDCSVQTSELSHKVYTAAERNFSRLPISNKQNLQLFNCSYQQLLERRGPATGPEIYIIDPPYGDAYLGAGLDFTETKPSLPQIIEDIAPKERGAICWLVLKGTDSVVQPAFDRIWTGATLLTKVSTEPKLEFGRNTVFYVYSYND